MLKILNEKEDLVFVGGVAMVMHGKKKTFNDIDVVVKNLEGIPDPITYETDSPFSLSGKRAFSLGKVKIDIFIEEELPEFEIIDGLKIETKKAMREYYEWIYPKVKDHWKPGIEHNLKLLRDE